MTQLTLVQSQVQNLALRLDLGDVDPKELTEVLKSTAFKGGATDAQMTALLVVAQQYNLNPWTKEIWAFPDSRNGIVPIVSVDGWSRIINDHPEFDGVEFTLTGKDDREMAITCSIYRKDRSRPTVVTEYLEECKRDTQPWKSHKRRMLRHKAWMQCGRLAFGFGGVHDTDEAEAIIGNQPPATEIGADGSERQLMPAASKAARPAAQGPMPAPRPRQNVEDATVLNTTAQAQAPAPAQAAAPRQQQQQTESDDSDTGELASDGHKRNLELKAKAAGVDLTEILKKHGFSAETLTITQFATIKAALA